MISYETYVDRIYDQIQSERDLEDEFTETLVSDMKNAVQSRDFNDSNLVEFAEYIQGNVAKIDYQGAMQSARFEQFVNDQFKSFKRG